MNLDPGYLVANLLLSGVGFVLFSYGKKQRRFPHMAIGILVMVYPYFVTSIGLMIAIGALLMALLAAAVFLLGM